MGLLTLAVGLALHGQRNIAALGLALLGIWAFGWHMSLHMRRLDIDDPASCLAAFRANRDAGLLVALFLAMAAAV